MPIILLENDNDPSKGKRPDLELDQQKFTENFRAGEKPVSPSEDDFAIFPQWDVVPPNAIINPRLKKKI